MLILQSTFFNLALCKIVQQKEHENTFFSTYLLIN